MLDEHYGVELMFDAISKEFYSLKWRSSESIAEFGVCLLQQVQILQLENPGRIQPEHVDELQLDYFHKGLNPEYQQILAHKVDGEHPASYSNLLLAAWKLEGRQRLETLHHKRHLQLVDWTWHILRCQGICFPYRSWKAIILSPLELWPLEMIRLRKIPV